MNKQKKKYLRSNFNKTTIKSIDRMILTNLKKQAKLQAKFMIEINENFKNFLIKEYDLDYSNFKCCETFLNDCNLDFLTIKCFLTIVAYSVCFQKISKMMRLLKF